MVQGDFDNIESLREAMNGAHGVFAMSDFWEHGYDSEVAHGANLINAAKSAGISHFVFSSVGGADRNSGVPHFDSKYEIELLLRDSELEFTIIRPAEFMDNVQYMRKEILSGTYYDPRDSGKTHQWIAASDIGFFAGEAFDNPQEWLGKAIDIAGDELSIAEFTDMLSRTTGLDVHHQQITWQALEDDAGLEITAMIRWFNNIGYDADVVRLRERYPNLLTYEQYMMALGWNE